MTPPENTAAAPPLTFRWSPSGNGLKALLRVFDGEDLIETDTVDALKKPCELGRMNCRKVFE